MPSASNPRARKDRILHVHLFRESGSIALIVTQDNRHRDPTTLRLVYLQDVLKRFEPFVVFHPGWGWSVPWSDARPLHVLADALRNALVLRGWHAAKEWTEGRGEYRGMFRRPKTLRRS